MSFPAAVSYSHPIVGACSTHGKYLSDKAKHTMESRVLPRTMLLAEPSRIGALSPGGGGGGYQEHRLPVQRNPGQGLMAVLSKAKTLCD